MARYNCKDIAGKKYNKLTAISFSFKKINKKFGTTKHYWLFKCDCGNEKVMVKSNITKGLIKSCGCLKYTLTNPENKKKSGEKSMFNNYIKNSISRNINFCLSFDEFKSFIYKNCYYCNDLPANNNKYNYPFNGIDRMDPTIGYSIKNCVSCCSKCNYSKHTQQFKEFKDHILKIYLHLFKK